MLPLVIRMLLHQDPPREKDSPSNLEGISIMVMEKIFDVEDVRCSDIRRKMKMIHIVINAF